jgi:hypothetical protein
LRISDLERRDFLILEDGIPDDGGIALVGLADSSKLKAQSLWIGSILKSFSPASSPSKPSKRATEIEL